MQVRGVDSFLDMVKLAFTPSDPDPPDENHPATCGASNPMSVSPVYRGDDDEDDEFDREYYGPLGSLQQDRRSYADFELP